MGVRFQKIQPVTVTEELNNVLMLSQCHSALSRTLSILITKLNFGQKVRQMSIRFS